MAGVFESDAKVNAGQPFAYNQISDNVRWMPQYLLLRSHITADPLYHRQYRTYEQLFRLETLSTPS